MEKYKKYKNSGIDWLLDEIPNHWETKRIKDLCKMQSGFYISANDFQDEGFPIYGGNGFRGFSKDYNHNGEYTLIGRQGALCGNVNYAKGKFWATEHAIVVYEKKRINKFWFGELLRLMNLNQYSLSAAQPGLSVEKIKRLKLPFIPKLKEQTEIANYLDSKTQTIDKKVKLLSEKISTYKDYRKTLINQTVTKGLDKNVKLKNSGINWIGEIPKHWEVKRFKSFGKTIKGKNMEMSDLKFDNSLPLLSLEYLRNDSVQHPTFCYSNDKSLKSTNEDLIIVWDGAAVGEILKSKVGYVSSTIAKLEINKKKFNTRYFYHLRGAIDYKLKQIPTGMGIPHLNPTLFKNFKCPTPPLKEQQAIANYLDAKTQTIDTIIKNIENQITTLKELRKTLINEVVTGNVKITE
ncbi:restriction endonuclease subunit S [Tenacibaculum piscium]|uniref:Restriction endonuclease S subunit n=1 Tax=Tenacibaculum piscium TaxID=1458515 RepID=A0A2H1YHA4_9FLAO|nr:restriction endonuclease subunit S [Tenacibaculum piscium]MBE7630152.1 restriction endonuclease subunit S [Tenacibaculum piscium]SOS74820.1 Restriction endonuclease S subunit [Tenacibaculum piscium]